MKKVVILLSIFLFAQAAYGNEYFDLGKAAYENGRYGQAKEYLELAVRNKPKNVTYRYYYALSLSRLGLIEEATKQYQTITMSYPHTDEGQSSMVALESLKKYYETKAGEFKLPDADARDYMPYIIIDNNSTIKRWDKDELNVYIQSSPSRTIVEKAFNIWEDRANGILKFNFVPAKELADITVAITDRIPLINSEEGRINGSISIKYANKNIIHADIIIQDMDTKTQEEFSPDLIYTTSLHMIGHAIGLNTHSENPKDIMYWELGPENQTISKADINTLNIIYNISPENMKEIHDNSTTYSIQLQKAKVYAEAHPQLPTAWSGLAAAYVNVGDYNKAVESIQKAIDLDNDDPTLYTQLGGFYLRLNKHDLSQEAYKKAYDLQPDNKVYLYNWAKSCYKNHRAEEARPTVDAYLMGKGFLANDEISRLLRRMYKQDKTKEKEKILKDREEKQKKMEELQEAEQEMFVD